MSISSTNDGPLLGHCTTYESKMSPSAPGSVLPKRSNAGAVESGQRRRTRNSRSPRGPLARIGFSRLPRAPAEGTSACAAAALSSVCLPDVARISVGFGRLGAQLPTIVHANATRIETFRPYFGRATMRADLERTFQILTR